MSLYTLMLATVINVNKELPVQGGLTLEECKAAAMEALLRDSNYAKCRPTQPEKPLIFVKLSTGVVVEVERQNGGYMLPPGYSVDDEAFVATVLGKRSSGVHSQPHGPDREHSKKGRETLVTD